MKWKHPQLVKLYEAIGCVADGRVEVSGDTAKVYSSSRNKYYDISYDSENHAIMSNDNSSFWKATPGYPAVGYLLKIGVLPYDSQIGELLKGIAWKDINQKYKNKFDKALEHILSTKSENERALLLSYVHKIDDEIKKLDLKMLGKRTTPPEGY